MSKFVEHYHQHSTYHETASQIVAIFDKAGYFKFSGTMFSDFGSLTGLNGSEIELECRKDFSGGDYDSRTITVPVAWLDAFAPHCIEEEVQVRIAQRDAQQAAKKEAEDLARGKEDREKLAELVRRYPVTAKKLVGAE